MIIPELDALLNRKDTCRWCPGDKTLGQHEWRMILRKDIVLRGKSICQCHVTFTCDRPGCNGRLDLTATHEFIERIGVEVPVPGGGDS